MKHTCILLILAISTTTVFALPRNTDTIPVHLQNLKLPDFKLLLPDSTNFYTENLSKKKHTIIIYFSPECDHCIHQTEEIIQSIDRFSGTQIVMATTLPFEKMKLFYTNMKISKYRNIIMGQDVLFFFPKYYRNHYLPGIAVYNKKRALLNFYDGGVKTEELIKLIQ
jgi:peroxiredoxin